LANKQLTVKLRLNTTQFESQLRKINAQTNALNNAINRGTTGYNQANTRLRNINSSVRNWRINQRQVNNSIRTGNSLLSSANGKLKALATTYLGIMGMKATTAVTDTMIGAQNRLNYSHSKMLGEAGRNADGTYSTATFKATQDAMDKMYTSSQKVRMSYTDMMSNVGKFMTLAPSAFQNNTDNAIRFQEIMAEAYAVGGASAAEMSSSMYQLTQALGAGTLAGDELRSVREGAPLAYQAIEKFAQGVYKTEESLKDLASQGKITSDMVVAAIMTSGNELDAAFAQTAQTFGQTWTQIKNAAKKAFEPVATMLKDSLNEAIDNGLINKIEGFFIGVSKVLQITFKAISIGIQWIVDNWYWLEAIVFSGLITLAALWAYQASVAILNFIIQYWWLMIIVAALWTLIYTVFQWAQGTVTTTQLISQCLLFIATLILVVAALTGSTTMLIIGLVMMAVALIIQYLDYVAGAVWLVIMFCVNLVQLILNVIAVAVAWLLCLLKDIIATIVNLVCGLVWMIIAMAWNMFADIINGAVSLYNVLEAVGTNIGIAFENAFNAAKSAFWSFVANCLEGVKALEPAINAIAQALGAEGFTLTGVIDNVRSKAESAEARDYVSIGDAWARGQNTVGKADVFGGFNVMEHADWGATTDSAWNLFGTAFEDGWSNNAWNDGFNWGAGVQDSINDWGAGGANWLNDKLSWMEGGLADGSILDSIGESLGLNFKDVLGDPNSDVSGAYNRPSDEVLKGIGDDVGSINDSLDLSSDDLEYLRKIAEMEWKKEYTTASIKVDMSNYNTINGESDLDGIVTKLADKLYEEMNVVADGVYA
jgi:tape measure domain-containing protein